MDNRFPLISIIVPIYNIGSYVTRCIDSVVNQTYKYLEIILVDDGSTDESGIICDNYALVDSRIIVVHKNNGGLSDARNVGLDIATGEYITFIDGDDWYDETIIESLVNEVTSNRLIISYSAYINYQDGEEIGSVSKNRTTFFGELAHDICNEEVNCSVCTKIFSRSIIENDIRFINGRLNEDFFFLMAILIKYYSYNYFFKQIDTIGYHYFMREGSITHSNNKKSVLDAIDNCNDLFSCCKKSKIDLFAPIARMGLHQSYVAINVNPTFAFTKKNLFFSKPLSFVRKNIKSVFKARMKTKEKIVCIFFFMFPHMVSASIFILRKLFK